MHWRKRFAEYLSEKSNFVRFGTVCFSAPLAVAMLWQFGDLRGAGWWLFLVVVCFISGWVWAQLMWLVHGHDFQKNRPNSTERKEPTDH
jgi:hypothetical protein